MKQNHKQRSLKDAERVFKTLYNDRNNFTQRIKKRLEMIKKNWNYFTAFYHVKNCPATNNAIENYYSTSLKTHRKKQFRTRKGILNHMKLSAIKRIKNLTKPKTTIIELVKKILFLT